MGTVDQVGKPGIGVYVITVDFSSAVAPPDSPSDLTVLIQLEAFNTGAGGAAQRFANYTAADDTVAQTSPTVDNGFSIVVMGP
jgi:hypothetical protein